MATEDLDMGKAWELKKLIRPRRLEIKGESETFQAGRNTERKRERQKERKNRIKQ